MRLSEVKELMEGRILNLWKDYLCHSKDPETSQRALETYRKARELYKRIVQFEAMLKDDPRLNI